MPISQPVGGTASVEWRESLLPSTAQPAQVSTAFSKTRKHTHVRSLQSQIDDLTISLISDLNECLRENGGCQHICEDTAGSYQCACRPDYSLALDEHSCERKSWSLYDNPQLSQWQA